MAKLWIGNLPQGIPDQDVEDIFAKFGRLRSCWVARKPAGFGFVEYEDRRDAEDAVRGVDGRNGWRVEFARAGAPKEKGSYGGGGGGGFVDRGRPGGYGGREPYRGRSPSPRRRSGSPPRRRRSPSYEPRDRPRRSPSPPPRRRPSRSRSPRDRRRASPPPRRGSPPPRRGSPPSRRGGSPSPPPRRRRSPSPLPARRSASPHRRRSPSPVRRPSGTRSRSPVGRGRSPSAD